MSQEDAIPITKKSGLSAKQQAVLDQLLKGKTKLSRDTKADTIPRREVFSPAALSFSQQRLWILDQLVPGSAFYNIPSAYHINGNLDIDVFERSLNELIRRHESLRTVFKIINEEPQQVILEELELKIKRFDLRELSGAEQEAEMRRILVEDASRPFDLEHGPLLRVNLLHLGENRYVFQYNMHHIISDTWSMEIFIKEFVEISAAFVRDKPSPLPPLPIQYPDFAIWQREWMQGRVMEKQLNYWKEVLSGDLPILELPTDRQRPAVPTYHGRLTRVAIPRELTTKLLEINRATQCSMFMNLLTIFYVLLYRWSGQDDILVGSPIANRKRVEIERLIGFFANTLVFRTRLDGSPAFLQLLERVRSVTTGAYDHQDIPFEKLVEELQPDRYMSHTPFFQVMMVLQNVPHHEADASSAAGSGELSVAPVAIHSGSAKFDLWFSFVQVGDYIDGIIEYSTDIFEHSTIERFARHFSVLVAAVCENPGCSIDELEIMDEEEKHRLLYEWNDTARDYQLRCLHHAIAEQAQRTPHRIALTAPQRCPAGAGEEARPAWESLTYLQLRERAVQLARHLVSLGARPGMPIGICMERSLDMVTGLLAILEAGAAYLPLDPEYPADRLAFMVEDAQLSIVLSQQDLRDRIPAFAGQVVCPGQEENEAQPAQFTQTGQAGQAVGVTLDDLAYVIYTSGSTGKPKGVMIPHRGISNRLLWMQEYFGLTVDDHVLQKTPYSFDVSVWEFFWPLMNGAQLVMARPGGHKDSAYLVEVIKEQKITTVHFVPSMLNVFLETPGVESLTSLKRVICSGEALPPQYRDRFFGHMPGQAQLYNLYGPTEASVDVSYWHCDRADNRPIIPIGRPVANTQLYILNKNLQLLPTGVYGELHIGGIQLAKGYLGRPQLTEEKFAVGDRTLLTRKAGSLDPLTPWPILYKTGDLCRWLPDGTIEFIDRLDFQVKVRGFRIELGEIESRLREHENVHDAVVLAREDGTTGKGKKLVAYAIPTDAFMHLGSDQVENWQEVFDDTYRRDSGQEDVTFNITGWNSSYTGSPIPADEMRLWVDHTVQRILSLRPRHVMEIGCGTGLFLFPLVPHCETFLGTDIAAEGLAYIRSQLEKMEEEGKTQGWARVKLEQRKADNFAGIDNGAFDLVFLNSVVQYFPTVDYLVQVLTRAVDKVKPGGAIFIGDVRDLSLLKALHASVEFFRADPAATREEVYRQMMNRLALEQELVIHPGFFDVLQQQVARISGIEILVKYGRYENELSKFRCDVLIHIGDGVEDKEKGEGTSEPAVWLDWDRDQLNAANLAEILPRLLKDKATAPHSLLLANLPNSRTAADLHVLEWLTGTARPEAAAVSEYLQVYHKLKTSTAAALDPEDIRDLGKEFAYDGTVTLARSGVPGRMDVLFTQQAMPGEEAQAIRRWARRRVTAGEGKTYRDYSNNPLLVKITGSLVPQLRDHLRECLPEYMVPSSFVLLDHFPLTANGKLDRRALPQPLRLFQETEETFIAPSTEMEELLAQVWGDVLNLEKSKISMNHNFFQLGGDSINAIQVVSRLGKLGHHMDVQLLYRNQTIADLAASMAKQEPGKPRTRVPSVTSWTVEVDRQIIARQLAPGIEIEDIYPAAPLQMHQARFLEQGKITDPPIYLFQRTFRPMNGSIDLNILEQAMQIVSRQNTHLRTLLVWKGLEKPVQVICRELRFELDIYDLSGLDLDFDAKMEKYGEILQEDWRRTFDRCSSSPMRVGYVQLADQQFVLFFSGDYMRLEGWSGNNVIADIFAVYGALATSSPLPGKQPNCYKEFVFTIREQDRDAARDFWQSAAKDLPKLDLFTNLAGNQKSCQRGYAREHVYLGRENVARMEKVLMEKGWSVSTLIQAIWTVLLSYYTGQDRVVYGMMNTGRSLPIPGIEYMNGQSINILPTFNEIRLGDSLEKLIKRTWDSQVEWSRFECTNIDDIYEWLGISMESPMFEHFMVIQNLSSATGDIRGMERDATNYQENSHLMFAKMEYPLRFDVFPGVKYCLILEYYRGMFCGPAVKGLLANMKALLEAVIENPRRSVEEMKNMIDRDKYKLFEDAPASDVVS